MASRRVYPPADEFRPHPVLPAESDRWLLPSEPGPVRSSPGRISLTSEHGRPRGTSPQALSLVPARDRVHPPPLRASAEWDHVFEPTGKRVSFSDTRQAAPGRADALERSSRVGGRGHEPTQARVGARGHAAVSLDTGLTAAASPSPSRLSGISSADAERMAAVAADAAERLLERRMQPDVIISRVVDEVAKGINMNPSTPWLAQLDELRGRE
jgi:hypothetical protein